MSNKYKIFNEDGELSYTAEFKYNPCCCSGDCNEGELMLYELGSNIPYRLYITGSELKHLIRCLLDGEYTAEKIDDNQ